jgi:hypothetical protein
MQGSSPDLNMISRLWMGNVESPSMAVKIIYVLSISTRRELGERCSG